MFVVYLLAAVIVSAILAMVFLSHLKSFKLTSQTNGEVTGVEEREIRDENERREETTVAFRYFVKDKEYELKRTFRGRRAARFPAGRVFIIRYNPAQPAMSDVTLNRVDR